MRYAIIEHNKVANVAVAEYALASNWIQSGTAAVGDDFINGEIVPQSAPQAPSAPRTLTKVAYLKRFTQAERIGIREAAKVNVVVEDYVELLNLAQDVDLADPETIAGVQQLEAAGLLAAGRAAEILA